jgi:hypothetical protein
MKEKTPETNRILRFIHYLFYSYFKKALKGKGDRTPKITASSKIALLIIVNFTTMIFVFVAFTKTEIFVAKETKYWAVVISLFIAGIVHFYFISKGRFENIIDEFDQDSEIERERVSRIASWLMLISFFLCLMSLIFLGISRGNSLW